jgi:adenosylcobinamide-GDP ribazoletransferase
MTRRFLHALQFLTRLPAPHFDEFDPEDLSRSAVWFPLIGIVIGAAVAAAAWAGGTASPWIGGLLGLVAWVLITGGLHLDGLGDVADALGASHRSPQRFLEVLRDPHIGAFGSMAIALQLIAKIVLLTELAGGQAWPALVPALVLVPAWARWGTLVWSLTVPALASGSGERFSWQIRPPAVAVEGLVLMLASAWASPVLLVAPLVVGAVSIYWRYRLGGITGDGLGASVEVTETALLLSLALAIA